MQSFSQFYEEEDERETPCSRGPAVSQQQNWLLNPGLLTPSPVLFLQKTGLNLRVAGDWYQFCHKWGLISWGQLTGLSKPQFSYLGSEGLSRDCFVGPFQLWSLRNLFLPIRLTSTAFQRAKLSLTQSPSGPHILNSFSKARCENCLYCWVGKLAIEANSLGALIPLLGEWTYCFN